LKQQSLLKSWQEEFKAKASSDVDTLKKLGETVKTEKYHSEYSDYEFPTPQEVDERHNAIDEKWASLEKLANAKTDLLEEALKLEQEKERLRLLYAHQASEFVKQVKDIVENMTIEHFGFTLEEVQSYGEQIKKSTEEYQKLGDEQEAAITKTDNEMKAKGVKVNVYTKLNANDIANTKKSLLDGINVRQAAYSKELERQIYNDNLCRKFAAIAEPLAKMIADAKDTVTASKLSLEAQLEFVDGKLKSLDGDTKDKVAAINDLRQKMEEAKITNIRHTTLTPRDVEVLLQQYKLFLEAKSSMLGTEIENQKLRGLTPSQLKEIDDNFRKYDKDKNNMIDRKELMALLMSLGEDRSVKETTAILNEYGDPQQNKTVMTYEGFKSFMIHVLGDSDTKDEVINGLVLINRDNNVAHHDRMELVLESDDLKYFENSAKKINNGYDFRGWVDDMYSR